MGEDHLCPVLVSRSGEVLSPTHTPERVTTYTAFLEERSLLRTSGSDSHGPGGPRHRLPIPYPAASCAEFLGRCGIEISGP